MSGIRWIIPVKLVDQKDCDDYNIERNYPEIEIQTEYS